MPLSFGVTFDYRCPFARNVHEHVVAALATGPDWDVRFLPFSLSQAKVADGAPSVWEQPDQDSGILAMQLGIAIRDTQPDVFPAAHVALFGVRHDQAKSLRDEDVLRSTLAEVGVDVDGVFAEVASGVPLKTIAAEHEAGVRDHRVWGVPTFIAGDQAAFVRLMDRPRDGSDSVKVVERLVALLGGWPDLNEFKHTSIPR